MKKFRVLALILALVMCMSLMAACGSDGKDADAQASETQTDANASATVFKLGGIGPLTGGAAVYGTAVKVGAEIAVDEINAKGGDIQFELNFQDDEHDAEKSVNAYNNLKDWGMQALIGSVTTTPCIAVSAESYADRIFQLTPSASSTDVVDGKDNVFQVCFTDPNQGTASAQYIAEHKLATKIAVIYRNDDAYSTGIYNTFVAEAEKEGLEIVSATTFTAETANDFSVQLNEAKKAGAELVFLPIYCEPASMILTQANTMGYKPVFFGVDGMDGILALEGFDAKLAEGVMLLTPFSADAQDELTKSFVAEYESRTDGETPNQFAADAYDAVYTIYAAIEKAGVTADMSAQDICEALVAVMPELSVDGLTGTGMTWNANGEVSKAPTAVVIKDGVYVGAENDTAAEEPAASEEAPAEGTATEEPAASEKE